MQTGWLHINEAQVSERHLLCCLPEMITIRQGCVAVTLARPLHVSKEGQSKEKGKTKQATLISDFHAHGSKSSLWPIRLARN